jgi:uncharacterized membrane protein
MAAAVLALIGLLISVYLWLWKIGVLGELVCFDGGCETVQLSEYAYFLGIPVALLGLIGYLAILAVSLVGIQPRWVERREPTLALIALSGLGVAYSAYLTYLEAAVIHAWCQWCVISAVLICLTFIAALAGLWEVPREGSAGA